MDSEILKNIWGQVQSGSYQGWFVKVIDDREGDTGGYYILTTKSIGGAEGFDSWVETWQEVKKLEFAFPMHITFPSLLSICSVSHGWLNR